MQIKQPDFKWQELSRRQQMILDWWTDGSPYNEHDGIIADGAVRSGKTISMGFSFCVWAMENFNNQQFALCGKTVGSLRRNVILTLKRQLTARNYQVDDKKSENCIHVSKNGNLNMFYLFGGKDERSQDLIQGVTLAGVFFDEVALMPESFVNQATARCSVDGSKFWFNCNPAGPQHWFKQNWVNRCKEKRLVYIHFTMDDNLTLSEKIKERYRSQYAGVFYDRYIRGLWATADGIIYDMFEKKEHVRDAETEGDYYVSSDFGIQNATVFLFWRKEKDSGQWHCFREYYYSGREKKKQKTVEEMVQDLEQLLPTDEDGELIRPKQIIVDPSAAALIVALRKKQFKVRSADNDVSAGISDVATMLQKNQLSFSPKCKMTITEFGMYCWDEKAAMRGEDVPVKENDHCMDAVRYFVKTMKLVIKDRPYRESSNENSIFL